MLILNSFFHCFECFSISSPQGHIFNASIGAQTNTATKSLEFCFEESFTSQIRSRTSLFQSLHWKLLQMYLQELYGRNNLDPTSPNLQFLASIVVKLKFGLFCRHITAFELECLVFFHNYWSLNYSKKSVLKKILLKWERFDFGAKFAELKILW